MRYKAQIKRITKLQKPPFGDGMYTWEIEPTQHIGLYYTSKMSYNVGDEIEYGYIEQKNKAWKLDSIKKTAMYSNFTKDQNVNYQNTNDSRQQSIEYQSARNVVSQLYSGLGHQISLDEIAQKTIYLYNKQQEFFNNK